MGAVPDSPSWLSDVHGRLVRVLKNMPNIDLRRFYGLYGSITLGGSPIAINGRGRSSLLFLPLAPNGGGGGGWIPQHVPCV